MSGPYARNGTGVRLKLAVDKNGRHADGCRARYAIERQRFQRGDRLKHGREIIRQSDGDDTRIIGHAVTPPHEFVPACGFGHQGDPVTVLENGAGRRSYHLPIALRHGRH